MEPAFVDGVVAFGVISQQSRTSITSDTAVKQVDNPYMGVNNIPIETQAEAPSPESNVTHEVEEEEGEAEEGMSPLSPVPDPQDPVYYYAANKVSGRSPNLNKF